MENEYVLFTPVPVTDTAISSESSNVSTGIIAPIFAVYCVPSSAVIVRIPSSDSSKLTGIFSMLRSKMIFSPFSFSTVITPVSSSIVQFLMRVLAVSTLTFVESISMTRLSKLSRPKSILLRFDSFSAVFSLGKFSQLILEYTLFIGILPTPLMSPQASQTHHGQPLRHPCWPCTTRRSARCS